VAFGSRWRHWRWRTRGLRYGIVLLSAIIIGLVRYWPDDVPDFVDGRARVIDGDSLRVAGEEIRLVGIDAPEGRQTCRKGGADWNCGRAASDALRARIGRKALKCDVEGLDKYGRLLAVCMRGSEDLNGWMVQQGWAVSYGRYAGAERDARSARRGIWNSEFDRPQDWRDENLTGAVAASAS